VGTGAKGGGGLGRGSGPGEPTLPFPKEQPTVVFQANLCYNLPAECRACTTTTFQAERDVMSIWNAIQAVRQNHALEHATMHMLSRHNPYLQLMGRSMATGFVIYGQVDTQTMANAASEALCRLQRGEAHLAVHPRCGTNLAVTSLLAGTAAFGASTLGRARSRFDRLPAALLAATVAALIAQPLAHRVQEHITTSPHVEGLVVDSITREERGKFISHKVVIGRN